MCVFCPFFFSTWHLFEMGSTVESGNAKNLNMFLFGVLFFNLWIIELFAFGFKTKFAVCWSRTMTIWIYVSIHILWLVAQSVSLFNFWFISCFIHKRKIAHLTWICKTRNPTHRKMNNKKIGIFRIWFIWAPIRTAIKWHWVMGSSLIYCIFIHQKEK